jgi:mediator of RNA polymerase II transcription subunit 12, fungi type
MDTRSESFISPKVWIKYRATLSSCIFPESAQESPAYRSIDQRNRQLTFPDVKMDLSPRRAVIGLLDKSLSGPFSINLTQHCREIMPDLRALPRTVLDWTTSSYRPGLAKVYVGARLLRTLSRSGVDVNEVILDFLGSDIDGQGLCKPSVYHLASELTRSGHFSVSKYIQWLIARGGVRRSADVAKDGPCATRLLAELPMHDSPDSICRLRRTMLSRASFFMEQEREELAAHTAMVDNYLAKPGDDKDSIMAGQGIPSIERTTPHRSSLSRSIKSEIGVWIRKKVLSYVVVPATTANAWKEEKPSEIKITITLNEFNVVRGVLEDIGDLTILADILKIIIPSDDLQVLASVTDTLNFHVEEFGAIGALNDLFHKLLARFRSMADENDSTVLLAALANLAGRLPGTESVAQQLSQELLRINRKTAADACSPVSEHMAEVLQSSESEFSDEVEKVLASGTYMETSTLKRLFQVIMSRIEASWAKSSVQQRNCTSLLSRLRNFDMKQFDALMKAWLWKFLQYPKRPEMAHVLGPLISADCLDIGDIIMSSEAALELSSEQRNPSIASKIAFETLALLLGTPIESDVMSINDAYYLGIRRLHFQKDNPQKALAVVQRAVELCPPTADYDHDSPVSLCRSEQMRKFLRHTVLSDLDTVIQELILPLAKISRPETSEQLINLIEPLLDPEAGNKTQERTLAYRIEHTLRLADDLTLPFCQLELQMIFATEAGEWANEENSSTGCLEAFERAVDSAIASNNRSWTSIIPMLDIQIARHLCQRAERLLFQLVPSIKGEDSNGSLSGENDDLAKKLLFVIHATTYSMQANRNSHLASQIVEKLNDIWQIASHGTEESRSGVIDKWLPLMLDFITLHINMFDNSKSSSELRSRMLLSLSALLLELQTCAKSLVLQRIFDVAILLVDDLSDDARLNCIRSLKDKTFNPRIEYIFGYSAPPNDWLQLSQNGKLIPYPLRRWEILSEPTPIVGENDTSLSLTLFKARKV